MSFHDLDLHPRLLDVLRKQGIIEPTPIQAKAIPHALEGRDVLAIAQTGTGKTLGFALPTLSLLGNEKGVKNRILILTPTRELAKQIQGVMEPLARAIGQRTICIYGGVGMEPQVSGLRAGCAVVVATPGRLLDHMSRGLKFPNCDTVILDEADRMLDMGFMPDIKRILSALPEQRQTLLFSATFPREIEQLTKDMLNDPVRIEIAPQSTAAEAVRQHVYTVHGDNKMDLLAQVLSKPEVKTALVFIRTKHRTDRVAKSLSRDGFKAQSIHGGRSQNQRQQALDGFKRGRFNILVATDVAARGIDVQGITHVVNFDIPKSPDDYIHRIGRTARASAEGDAFTFVSPEDHAELGAIERVLGRNIDRVDWEGAIHVRTAFDPSNPHRPQGQRQGQGRNGNGGGQRRSRNGGGYRSAAPRRDDAARHRDGHHGPRENHNHREVGQKHHENQQGERARGPRQADRVQADQPRSRQHHNASPQPQRSERGGDRPRAFSGARDGRRRNARRG